ncbi:hypothetical protein KM043_005135 [Ampulex compressa]|nr:hypothetical protein KM043_005135 [Ampulex compressa]
MRTLETGWYAACLLLCACAAPEDFKDESILSSIPDLEAMATGFGFDEASVDELSEMIRADLGRRLIPIGSATPGASPMRPGLEPDAEMLPAHFENVKPPGVDHMELRLQEPRGEATDSNAAVAKDSMHDGKKLRAEQGGGLSRVASKQVSSGVQGKQGGTKTVAFEEGTKGEVEKERQKSQYSEGAGRKKEHSEREESAKGHEDGVSREKGASYEVESSRDKGHKAAGYRNVYHKDEYKKDADFYDNDHQGGHFKKHGRYGEKHVAIEGTFKKGASGDLGFDSALTKKAGMFEKGRAAQKAQGRSGKQGYDEFFKNLAEFAKKADHVEGKKYGFLDVKAR